MSNGNPMPPTETPADRWCQLAIDILRWLLAKLIAFCDRQPPTPPVPKTPPTPPTP